jgi:hypothetical protein
MFGENYFLRSQFLQKLNDMGYPIKHNDISWACDNFLIEPETLRDNLYVYSTDDIEWMERLGRLKMAGIDKATILRLAQGIRDGLWDDMSALVERLALNNQW